MLERDKSGRPTPISPERFEICYKIVSKDNTGGHCEELNDMHQRHVDEEKNMDKSEPQNQGVTWADIVKKETMFESIKNNSH